MRRHGTFIGTNPISLAGKLSTFTVLGGTLLLFYAVSARAAETSLCEDPTPVRRLVQQATDEAAPYTDRRAAFEELLRRCPDNPGSYAAYSVLLLKHSKVTAALQWINRGLKIAPENSDLQLALGVALLSAGRARDVLEVLNKLPADAKTDFIWAWPIGSLARMMQLERRFCGRLS
jgi:tetratricopeptide (TPR) repeat protein